MDILLQRVTKEAPTLTSATAPGFPPELVRIVDRMLAREPSARYANAGALLDDLSRFPTLQTKPDFVPPEELIERYQSLKSGSQTASTEVGAPALAVTEADGPPPAAVRAAEADAIASAPTQVQVADGPGQPHAATATHEFDVDDDPRPRRARRGWLVALGILLVLGGVAAGVWAATQSSDGSSSDAQLAGAATTGEPANPSPPTAAPADPTRTQAAPASTADRPDATEATAESPPTDPTTAPTATAQPVDNRLGRARPALPDDVTATILHVRADTIVTVALPSEAGPLYRPLPLTLALDRAGAPLRIAGGSATVTVADSDEPVATVDRVDATPDGRATLMVPARPLATTYRLALTLRLPDGETVSTVGLYDANAHTLRAR